MKLLFALLTLAPAAAFVPGYAGGRPSFALSNARVDSASAVAEALEISKKFGATSKEARIAWENVEEMDSSDNRYEIESRIPWNGHVTSSLSQFTESSQRNAVG